MIRTFAFAGLVLFLFSLKSWAVEPTLARLSFPVPPERMAEFEAVYEEKAVPVLKTYGLVESPEEGRVGPDSLFSRLFELKAPSEVADKRQALQADPAWREVLQGLGATFRAAGPDSLIPYAFLTYSAPAGPGKVVSAGPGKVVPAGSGTGSWREYGAAEGLTEVIVQSIFQDREGYLWFAARGGVSRYDGQTFTTFRVCDEINISSHLFRLGRMV